MDLTTSYVGYTSIIIFALAYVLVMVEEFSHLRKSKPVIISAALIWGIIAFYFSSTPEYHSENIEKAQIINLKLAKLHNALFIESSPGPVKYAAELLGLCSAKTRLPLVPIQESTKKIVKDCLVELGLL